MSKYGLCINSLKHGVCINSSLYIFFSWFLDGSITLTGFGLRFFKPASTFSMSSNFVAPSASAMRIKLPRELRVPWETEHHKRGNRSSYFRARTSGSPRDLIHLNVHYPWAPCLDTKSNLFEWAWSIHVCIDDLHCILTHKRRVDMTVKISFDVYGYTASITTIVK